MRKGYDANLALDKKGQIFAISTGSDATSEHEWGISRLVMAMCGSELPRVAKVKDALIAGMLKDIPDIFEERRILPHLEALVFEEGTAADGTPVAALGCSDYCVPLVNLPQHPELRLSDYELKKGQVCSGAWDGASFAFSVRGERLVKKLRSFYDALQAGHGMFAGHILESPEFSGIVLCDTTKLRPEHRANMHKEQALFESKVKQALLEHERTTKVS